eukprot:TRINITY_DN8190_c1_g2_i1.p1 TRINITY_DN8190_c1_g2~~TRINITY_DN8190_c1_g2_i1.p1  ORF type:complete len:119 (-),score=2.72 TRINITY_DN8190_c1_g2_i1:142-498(-)
MLGRYFLSNSKIKIKNVGIINSFCSIKNMNGGNMNYKIEPCVFGIIKERNFYCSNHVNNDIDSIYNTLKEKHLKNRIKRRDLGKLLKVCNTSEEANHFFPYLQKNHIMFSQIPIYIIF